MIQLSMDTSLNELLALGIPARELDDLYTYVKHGRPESGQADKGVHIGYSIDKQARAEVYRLICKAYRGIESKTVPVKGGGELVSALVITRSIQNDCKYKMSLIVLWFVASRSVCTCDGNHLNKPKECLMRRHKIPFLANRISM